MMGFVPASTVAYGSHVRFSWRTRVLTCVLAAIQFAAPASSAVADGLLAQNASLGAATHIEAATTSACPLVHAPDCGLCRYLSLKASSDASAPTVSWSGDSGCRIVVEATAVVRPANDGLPNGRAPPTI